jgi:hypothetical protein
MEQAEDAGPLTRSTVALFSDPHVPAAHLVPPRPVTLADVLNAAIERLEDFTLDVYEHGRTIGDPHVIWANGGLQMLREILDCFPVDEVTSTSRASS